MNYFLKKFKFKKVKVYKILFSLFIFLFIFSGFFNDWYKFWKYPNFPPKIEFTKAVIGVQHEYAWGCDLSSTEIMGNRPTKTGNDVKVQIKVGASTCSDFDPILRLQIVNTSALTAGEAIKLWFTDCTGSAVATCAGRSTGALDGDPTINWIPVAPQADGTATRLFRMRESNASSLVSGAQLPTGGIIGVTEHNPTRGVYVENDSTTVDAGTYSSYPSSDFSFEFFGDAPTSLKNYIFTYTIDGTLPGWSGMHAKTGALLDIIPANWIGSAIVDRGVAITSATTATTTFVFSDDSNYNSNTSFAFTSTTRSNTYTTVCSSDASFTTTTAEDGSSTFTRTCDFTGLTPSTTYWFEITHTDSDGVAGTTPEVIGPYYTDQLYAGIWIPAIDKHANDTTNEDAGELRNDDAPGTQGAQVAADDGIYSVNSGGIIFRLSPFDITTMPSDATIKEVSISFKRSSNNTRTQPYLNRADAGVSPSSDCSAGATPGTNWNTVWGGVAGSATWVSHSEDITSGSYSVSDLGNLEFCMNNNTSGGGATKIGFDYFQILSIYKPNSPTTTIEDATQITSSGAQLDMHINNQGQSSLAYFEYGETESYGSCEPDCNGIYVFNKNNGQHFYKTISSLTPNTLYHFRGCIKSPPSASASCSADNTFTTDVDTIISITLNTDGDIPYGIVAVSSTISTLDLTDTQTIENSGNVVENFTIKTTNATGGTSWTIGENPDSNIFVHEFSTSSGAVWNKFTVADSYQTMVNGLAVSSTQDIDLRITTPTVSDANQKNVIITILATEQ
jgi:hypothetical protein